MRRPSREDLYAYAAGALDPGRAHDVEEELLGTPELLAEIAQIRATLTDHAPGSWPIPQSGTASGRTPFRAETRPVLSMGGRERRVRILLHGAAPEATVLVLILVSDAWTVAHPTGPEDVVAVADLPLEGDAPVVELALGDDVERRAIALVPPQVAIDWDAEGADPWEAVKRGMEAGNVPVVSLEWPTRAVEP